VGAVVSRRHVCRNSGFTLVEVIVVLVILAILAAIAIPALTGYIDKAEDKQYIAQARNISVAMKTVVDEAYASGAIDGNAAAKTAFTQGTPAGKDDNFLIFGINLISQHLTGNAWSFFKRAATLIGEGEAYPVSNEDPGMIWTYEAYAPKDSGATAATADGFGWWFFPEGESAEFTPMIFVTYKVERIAISKLTYPNIWNVFNENYVYNSNAGYEVYHLTISY
jgi:prepilin-type N-terminal cleavage/methylation domain-containing protein